MIRTLSCGYRAIATAATTLAISIMFAPAAHASGSSMPWEQPLEKILQSRGRSPRSSPSSSSL